MKFDGFTSGGSILQMLINYFNGGSSTQQSAFFLRSIDVPARSGATQILITGPTQFLSPALTNNYCVGPFRVATVDANGVEVLPSSDITVETNVRTGTQLYDLDTTKQPCDSTTQKGSGNTYSYGPTSKKSSWFFYIKQTTSLYNNDYTQYFYATAGLNLHRGVIPLHFSVDTVPVPAKEASPERCSGSLCSIAPN
jgi:hypothetical protein